MSTDTDLRITEKALSRVTDERDVLVAEKDEMAEIIHNELAAKKKLEERVGRQDKIIVSMESAVAEGTIANMKLKRCLGNILAVIFGDGGQRYAEIGDDDEAVRQAHLEWGKTQSKISSLESHNPEKCEECWSGERQICEVCEEKMFPDEDPHHGVCDKCYGLVISENMRLKDAGAQAKVLAAECRKEIDKTAALRKAINRAMEELQRFRDTDALHILEIALRQTAN